MRVILLGHPVAHSLSPVMQSAAFEAAGLPHEYQAVDVDTAGLPARIEGIRAPDCLGANVTVPHKLAVLPAMDDLDDEARALQAVNTIVNRDGRLVGYNTDVAGAWEGLLAPVGGALRGGLILVLGAGGGARAVLRALGRVVPDGPDHVTVVARRIEQARAAIEMAGSPGVPVRAEAWSELAAEVDDCGVVVNCTTLGLDGEDPLEGLPLDGRVVLDLAYRPGGTALYRRALAEGSVARQGDGMLLQQGALAFELWTGRAAPVDAMRRALDAALA